MHLPKDFLFMFINIYKNDDYIKNYKKQTLSDYA